MDLQGTQRMVLSRGNGQFWLGAPPEVSQFIFVFFHFVVLQLLLRKKRLFSFGYMENDRMLLTIIFTFEKIKFSSGNLRSLI